MTGYTEGRCPVDRRSRSEKLAALRSGRRVFPIRGDVGRAHPIHMDTESRGARDGGLDPVVKHPLHMYTWPAPQSGRRGRTAQTGRKQCRWRLRYVPLDRIANRSYPVWRGLRGTFRLALRNQRPNGRPIRAQQRQKTMYHRANWKYYITVLFEHRPALLRSTFSLCLLWFAAPRRSGAQTSTVLHSFDSALRRSTCQNRPLLREGFG
jgi:hypothetical protein